MINRTCIVGNGFCARQIAGDLLSFGMDVVLVSKDNDSSLTELQSSTVGALELLSETEILKCRGHAGEFKISMEGKGNKLTRTVGIVILSEEDVREPNFSLYGLQPSPSVLSLSNISTLLQNPSYCDLKKKKIVFLTGLKTESYPAILDVILRSSLKLQTEFDSRTYIFTQNLKVAGDGMEALSGEAKKAGVFIIKFSHTLPRIRQNTEGRITISYVDDITGQSFTLDPDMTVVDETIRPSPYLRELSRVFELDSYPSGFVQTENVHRLSVYTNRKGILAAGPARGLQSPAQQKIDAKAAVIATLALENAARVQESGKVEIHPGRCIRCLTCYRLCPYRAVSVSAKVSIHPESCEGCGICIAECPRSAINRTETDAFPVSNRLVESRKKAAVDAASPFLIAFLCNRSAMPSYQEACREGVSLPKNLIVIPVPCAGSIATDHILTAFQSKADGVLILTCHEGNCHSEYGNRYALERIVQITDMLQKIGLERQRLLAGTLAANMHADFVRRANTFEETVRKLGPNRLYREES